MLDGEAPVSCSGHVVAETAISSEVWYEVSAITYAHGWDMESLICYATYGYFSRMVAAAFCACTVTPRLTLR